MNSCLDHLEQSPKLRAKVFRELGQKTTEFNEEKGHHGTVAGRMTRQKLVWRRKEQEQDRQENLDKLIKDAAKVSAL